MITKWAIVSRGLPVSSKKYEMRHGLRFQELQLSKRAFWFISNCSENYSFLRHKCNCVSGMSLTAKNSNFDPLYVWRNIKKIKRHGQKVQKVLHVLYFRSMGRKKNNISCAEMVQYAMKQISIFPRNWWEHTKPLE